MLQAKNKLTKDKNENTYGFKTMLHNQGIDQYIYIR